MPTVLLGLQSHITYFWVICFFASSLAIASEKPSSLDKPLLLDQYSTLRIDIDNLPNASSLYQIELLIFKHNREDSFDPDQIINEQWPDNLILSYPKTLDFINEPLPVIQKTEGLSATVIINNSKVSPQEKLVNKKDISHFVTSEFNRDNENKQSLAAYTEEEIALSKLILLTDLPRHSLQLSQAHQKIKNNTPHRVLYHRAWIQSLKKSSKANAIVIFGGQQYEDQYQLEGHLTISKDRFLHIKTDLWLKEFTPVQKSNKHVRDLSPEGYKYVFNENTEGFSNSIPKLPIDHKRIALIEERAFNHQLDNEIALTVDALYYSSTYNENIDGNLFSPNNNVNNKVTNVKGESIAPKDIQAIKYKVEKVYAVRQNKKISSRKINYLDHPKMGVIVSVKKYSLLKDD